MGIEEAALVFNRCRLIAAFGWVARTRSEYMMGRKPCAVDPDRYHMGIRMGGRPGSGNFRPTDCEEAYGRMEFPLSWIMGVGSACASADLR